ncbi:cation:proton antiporter [Halobacillus salinarum]|uniref:Cation:proton antiporter n=1 Tax=Halobacillus salinarum TaxID=2932257 RepID=A0ABY4EFE4_9BACI|nr:cation:proton antiporter family protein [Halobacillus salinarum]UOQ42762.1 cation:proton antiporter [Halobacillus salinarum]
MEHHSLTSLMIVVGIAFFIPIILQRLHLRFIPVVIAEIIAGLIIGKSGFNLISEDPTLELLSLLGFIFLMFISGLEIDFTVFEKKRRKQENHPNPIAAALLIFLSILVISFLLSMILVGLDLIKDPYLMTLIISTISLGIVVPVLKERKMTEGILGQIILLVTMIADFTTMILLTVYAMFRDQEGLRVLWLFVLFLAFFLAYRIIKRYFNFAWFKSLQKGTTQLGTRGVFALILLFVALSEVIGAENILGAFLAGVIISLLGPDEDFVHQLDSFGFGFLIPIFFVTIGVDLNIWELFVDRQTLLLMPLLLIFMYVAKLVPSLVLKKWYPWKEVFSIGILTTSKLSLVIAASAIALDLGVISETLNGAVILVSIITCLISPVVFTKLFPTTPAKKIQISIIGANPTTFAVARDLMEDQAVVRVYSASQEAEHNFVHPYPLINVDELSVGLLEEKGAFEADKIVFATRDDEINIQLGNYAKRLGLKTIVVRVEDQSLQKNLTDDENVTVYSTLSSTRTLLKALIENPGLVKLMTQHNKTIKEIVVSHSNYEHIPLTELPFLGESLILHIYRHGEVIIPHGHTTLQLGDKLLVSGKSKELRKIRREVSYPIYVD